MATHQTVRLPRAGIRIAVVQNASEIVHYSYGDSTEVFRDLGCRTTSYTDYSIGQLCHGLDDGEFDVVVLAANCLSSQAISSELLAGEGGGSLSRFVAAGRGVLIQHQLGLARRGTDEAHLPFLPGELSGVRARSRGSAESPWSGILGAAPRVGPYVPHVIEVAPNRIDYRALTRRSVHSPQIRALYWHFWEHIDVAWWDPLAFDVEASESRCLLAATREADDWRVVLAAVPFDWQREEAMLSNIVSYLADGRPGTVILTEPDEPSAVTRLAISATRAAQIPFREWEIGSDDTRLLSEAETRVFDNIVLSQSLQLDPTLGEGLTRLASRGVIKLFAVPAKQFDAFVVRGEHLDLGSLTREFIITCSGMCATGLVDGSFWATVDSLRALNGLADLSALPGFPGKSLELAMRTELPDGSYDGVFAASVGLAWLKWRFGDASLERTMAWVLNNVQEASARDRLYYTLVLAEMDRVVDLPDARAFVEDVRTDLAGQADLVLGAECALVLGANGVAVRYIEDLSRALGPSPTSSEWLDLGLASDVLHVSSQLVFSDGCTSRSLLACLEYSVEPVLGWLCREQAGQLGWMSARIRAKSLSALKTFARVSPLSVMTLVEMLDASTTAGLKRLQRDAGSDLVESLRLRHAVLEERSKAALEEAANMRRREKVRKQRLLPMRLLGVVAMYVLVTLVIAGVSESSSGWQGLWKSGFSKPVGIHLGIIGAVLTAASVYLALPAVRESGKPAVPDDRTDGDGEE